MEQDPDLDKVEHGMDINELRAKEKALMQHDRTCLVLLVCRVLANFEDYFRDGWYVRICHLTIEDGCTILACPTMKCGWARAG